MSDCLLSQAIGRIEDATDTADVLRGVIGDIYVESVRLKSKGVRLPRRLMRLIESAEGIADNENVTDALDNADAFVSEMELHGIKS